MPQINSCLILQFFICWLTSLQSPILFNLLRTMLLTMNILANNLVIKLQFFIIFTGFLLKFLLILKSFWSYMTLNCFSPTYQFDFTFPSQSAFFLLSFLTHSIFSHSNSLCICNTTFSVIASKLWNGLPINIYLSLFLFFKVFYKIFSIYF